MKGDKYILFMAKYPNSRNIKDGMVSRIFAIDNLFLDNKRIYLQLSYRHFWRKKIDRINENISFYQLNVVRHFFLIVKMIWCSGVVYTHSEWGISNIPFLLCLCSKKLVLDAHGVVPEEVRFYSKNTLLSWYLKLVERLLFKYANVVICVTNKMIEHFNNEYPKAKARYIHYNIVPSSIKEISFDLLKTSKKQLDKISVIYSGGVAKWQNIELMIESVAKQKQSNIEYIFLVNDPDYVKEKSEEYGISTKIKILSVMPDQLGVYYSMADYAFILRDNTVVNNVANPTKLIEYLNYGILPIVLCDNIGDFNALGYEYITLDNFIHGIIKPTAPSEKNMNIARSMMDNNRTVDIRNIVLSILTRNN